MSAWWNDEVRSKLRRIAWSSLCGVLVWAGEAVVGVVPLGAHEVVAGHAKLMPDAGAPVAEVCILSVVTSGLSLTSLLRFGPHKRTVEMTPFTYVMGIISMICLMVGALMYGLAATANGRDDDSSIYFVLYVALVSSFSMALEKSILEA